MIRYIPVLSLLLTGCADLTAEPEVVTNTVTVTEEVTHTVTITVPVEDTGSPTDTGAPADTDIEPLECGWILPSNGAFGDDVYVESIPTFTLVNATTTDPINHYQGEDAVFTFQMEASPCGAIELLNLFIVVQDVDGNPWLYEVYQNGTASVLEDVGNERVFNEVFAENMAITPSGDELHYEWCHDDYGSFVCRGILDQPVTAAGDTETFEFRFTSTHLTPIGEDYEIFVPWVMWRDLTTGQVVTDYTTYGILNRPVHCQ